MHNSSHSPTRRRKIASGIPRAVVINLPRHAERRAAVEQRLAASGLTFGWASAVDGSALSAAQRESNVTWLGRRLMTDGMIGCFLSHRRCWEQCVLLDESLLVLEDDVEPADGFIASLSLALREVAQLDDAWDCLLVGALGCVHPKCRYGANVLHGLMGGGVRWPRTLSARVHVPARAIGTHAYVCSPSGARKLLAELPRAGFHVDIAAWGLHDLRLYLATAADGQLLCKQAQTQQSTIGAVADRSGLPSFTVDAYTGAEFAWAFNAPVLQVGGAVLTVGRSICSSGALVLAAAASGSAAVACAAAGWVLVQAALIEALKARRGRPTPRAVAAAAALMAAVVDAARQTSAFWAPSPELCFGSLAEAP